MQEDESHPVLFGVNRPLFQWSPVVAVSIAE